MSFSSTTVTTGEVLVVLIERIPLWHTQTISYLVAPFPETRRCFIVDAPPDPMSILARLEHHEMIPEAILLTHGHIDSAAGAGDLWRGALERGLYLDEGLPVFVHVEDQPLLVDVKAHSEGFYRFASDLDLWPPQDLRTFNDSRALELAGTTVITMPTPGHTAGSTCFLTKLDDKGVVFSGDFVLADGIGRVDRAGANLEAMDRSLREFAALPADANVLPARGVATTVGYELANNSQLRERLGLTDQLEN